MDVFILHIKHYNFKLLKQSLPTGIDFIRFSLHYLFYCFLISTLTFFLLGKEVVDYIADYLENIRDRRVYPDVKPGFLRHMIPDSAPIDGENWETIWRDVDRVIMPGVSN